MLYNIALGTSYISKLSGIWILSIVIESIEQPRFYWLNHRRTLNRILMQNIKSSFFFFFFFWKIEEKCVEKYCAFDLKQMKILLEFQAIFACWFCRCRIISISELCCDSADIINIAYIIQDRTRCFRLVVIIHCSDWLANCPYGLDTQFNCIRTPNLNANMYLQYRYICICKTFIFK